MMNNFSCDQLHQDILTSSTQSSLNKHISDGVVHVTKEDHNKINNIPEIQNTVSELSTKVSDIQSTIDNSDYITNEELINKDYITKQSVKDLYVQKSQLNKDYASKNYVDEKISGLDIAGAAPNIQINASTDSTAIHVDVIKQSTGSDTKQDFKFKFTGFDNISGGSTSESYTIVTVYRTHTSNTEAPAINRNISSIPTYWSTTISGTDKYLWRSQARQTKEGMYLEYADFTYWSVPECCGIINGDTSEVGADTEDMDYVYWATNDDTNIVAPKFTVDKAKETFKTSDYITDNNGTTRMWYNHPTGVSSDKVYEYCSYAKYDNKNEMWGNYSIPFIFSHYGVDGKDGDGIEYIYCLNTINSAPEISYSGFTDDQIQQDDFIPSGGWSDDPQSVDEVNQYQFVAIRKKDGATGKWGTFSTPALWSVYVKPKDPDNPADVISQITYYKYGSKDEQMLNDAERKNQQAPDGWTVYPKGNPTDSDYLYMITSKTVNGVTVVDKDGYYWSEPVRITGIPGPAGTSGTGADGSDINYIYLRTTEKTVPTTPRFSVQDLIDYPGQYDQEDANYGTVTWYDHPSGITEQYKYEWVSIATKPSGTEDNPSPKWGSYGTPILWSAYGERGMDGDGVEYIYTRTTTENVPSTPTAKYGDNRDDDIPDNWTDNPSGVTEDYPYEYVSTRKKKGGEWGLYTTPALWAKYGKDGQQGPKGEPGINGKDGVSLMINIRRWEKCNVGDKFYKGDSGDPQVDVVYYNGKYYRCIKTFTLEEKAAQAPTVTQYWSEFESFTNIATELILADEASIENLLLNKAKAKNPSTGEVTVEIDGNTGKLTAKDAEIEGTIKATSISYSIKDISYNSSWTWHNVLFDTLDGDNIDANHTEITTEVLMMDPKYTVFIVNPVIDPDIDNVDSNTDAIVLGIPSAKKVGSRSLDIYFKDFTTQTHLIPKSTDNTITYNRPTYRWFIATCDITGNPQSSGGLFLPTAGCTVDIKNNNILSNEYKIQDYLNKNITFGGYDYAETPWPIYTTERTKKIQDFLEIPGQIGYVRIMPRLVYHGISGNAHFETPSHIRLMSDGESWYLIDYIY